MVKCNSRSITQVILYRACAEHEHTMYIYYMYMYEVKRAITVLHSGLNQDTFGWFCIFGRQKKVFQHVL